MEDKVFISLGTNLGDLQANLARACAALENLPRTRVTARSSALITRAVGLEDQPDFLNQVLRVSTELAPEHLLGLLLALEHDLGRVRGERWGPRIIDLDLLFYGHLVCRTEYLVLPHPQLPNRPFFIEMIREIDSQFLSSWPGAALEGVLPGRTMRAQSDNETGPHQKTGP